MKKIIIIIKKEKKLVKGQYVHLEISVKPSLVLISGRFDMPELILWRIQAYNSCHGLRYTQQTLTRKES